MKWLVADWNGNKGHVFDDVVRSLDALGHRIHTVSRSDMDRRAELIDAIRNGGHDVLLTWQRFYPMQKDILEALAESRIRTVYMDFGFVPHYGSVVFDTAGENAASTLPRLWESGGPPLSQAEWDAADALVGSEVARARRIPRPEMPALSSLRFPFAFVPLQRPRDAVVKHDSSVHDFGALVRRVLLNARGASFVVVKTHPLDHDLDLGVPDRIDASHAIVRQSFGALNETVCDYLMSRAALVVGVNSNMLFRAITFGTPVVASGRGWYTGSGAMHEVDGVSGLTSLSTPPPDLDAQRRYVATCLSRQLRYEELSDPGKLATMLDRIGLETSLSGACA